MAEIDSASTVSSQPAPSCEVDTWTIPFADTDLPEDDISFRLAVSRQWLWRNKKQLRYMFAGQWPIPSEQIKQKVLTYIRMWQPYVGIDLVYVERYNTGDPIPEIRISFNPQGGNWSKLGSGAAQVTDGSPTLNLGDVNTSASNESIAHIVLHEFGHALGCIHEHQSPKFAYQWDKPKLYAHFKTKYGWDPAAVDSNVLVADPSKQNELDLDASDYDKDSIMIYPFPKEVFIGQQHETKSTTQLTARDKEKIRQMYPPSIRSSGAASTQALRPGARAPSLSSVGTGTANTLARQRFEPPYNYPPKIALGITALDMDCEKPYSFKIAANEVGGDDFLLSVQAQGDSKLYSASTTWIEIDTDDDDGFQMGSYSFPKRGVPGSAATEWGKPAQKRIVFPRSFSEKPKVIAWVTGFSIEHTRGAFQLFVDARTCDKDGIDLSCHFDGKAYHSVDVNWIAYPADLKSVESGTAVYSHSTDHVKESRVSFPSGKFDDAPRVFAALCGMQFRDEDIRVDLSTSAVTAGGFDWRAQSWDDTSAGSVWFDWIAFGA